MVSGALPIEDQILVALRRVTRAIDLRSRTLLQDHGLTTPQLLTLLAVARLQPVTATAVAREVHLGQPTVTGILSRLERRGWIQRARAERDRRSVSISLTESGQQALEKAPSLLAPRFREMFRQLQDWEQTQLLASLQRLAQMMDAGLADEDELLEPAVPGPPLAGVAVAEVIATLAVASEALASMPADVVHTPPEPGDGWPGSQQTSGGLLSQPDVEAPPVPRPGEAATGEGVRSSTARNTTT